MSPNAKAELLAGNADATCVVFLAHILMLHVFNQNTGYTDTDADLSIRNTLCAVRNNLSKEKIL